MGVYQKFIILLNISSNTNSPISKLLGNVFLEYSSLQPLSLITLKTIITYIIINLLFKFKFAGKLKC